MRRIKGIIRIYTGCLALVICITACGNKKTDESKTSLEESIYETESSTDAETKKDMEPYAVKPTGGIVALGYWFRYGGKLYKASEIPDSSWFKNRPDGYETSSLGKITVVKGIPDNDMEGTRFDEGDIAYYDANADVILVHRIWITDYSWMLLKRND